MVFAIFGDIPFEVTGSPEKLVTARRYDYAEHRVIEDRPRLQWIADALETVRLELLLHHSLASPAVNLLLLQQAASSHAAMPLVFGNGDFRGYFVIAEIETLSRQLSGSGAPLAIAVRLTLREWAPDFDPGAPPLPSFSPIGIAAVGLAAGLVPSALDTGVSALLAFAPPTGPVTPNLEPNDVRPTTIVRSA
ncbi:MAG TPA: phage tail protein [Candidatus Binataceae bacterium]|nr:phage tail protein [Candidatus Binataceae bacterium]